MVRRVLAVLFGIVVIGAGLAIRADRADERGGVGTGAKAKAAAQKDPYEVFDDSGVSMLCIEELRALCEDTMDLLGFDVRVEPVWATVDRVSRGAPLGADIWLTVRPFPELAQPLGAAPAFGPATAVLARTPLVLVGPPAAIAGIDDSCPHAVIRFACATAGDRARNVALHDPRNSAFGVLGLAVVAHELGAPPDATTVDHPAVVDHLRGLGTGGRRSQAPYEDVVRLGGTATALTVEAEVLRALSRVPYDERETWDVVQVRYPIDVRAVEIVAVPSPSFRRRAELEAVLLSSAGEYGFERWGFVGRTGRGLDDAAVFKDRPVVRTDLDFSHELLRDLRLRAAAR